MLKFICYPKCTTCRKAKQWLDGHQMEYTDRNIVEDNPTYGELKEWYEKSGQPPQTSRSRIKCRISRGRSYSSFSRVCG